MKRIAFLAAVALAGCAQVPIEQRVHQASVMDVCEAVYYAPPQVGQIARQEAEARGVNCADYMQAIVAIRAQREANAGAARAAAIQGLMARPTYQPTPVYQMPIPQTVYCTGHVYGNTIQSQCR